MGNEREVVAGELEFLGSMVDLSVSMAQQDSGKAYDAGSRAYNCDPCDGCGAAACASCRACNGCGDGYTL